MITIRPTKDCTRGIPPHWAIAARTAAAARPCPEHRHVGAIEEARDGRALAGHGFLLGHAHLTSDLMRGPADGDVIADTHSGGGKGPRGLQTWRPNDTGSRGRARRPPRPRRDGPARGSRRRDRRRHRHDRGRRRGRPPRGRWLRHPHARHSRSAGRGRVPRNGADGRRPGSSTQRRVAALRLDHRPKRSSAWPESSARVARASAGPWPDSIPASASIRADRSRHSSRSSDGPPPRRMSMHSATSTALPTATPSGASMRRDHGLRPHPGPTPRVHHRARRVASPRPRPS